MITPAMIRAKLEGVDPSAATPGGIEASEKLGQITLVRSTMMPADMNGERAAFEALGFVFGEVVDGIFLATTLPAGWTKRATNHDMWSDVLDENGVVRVQVFYKAAFYDRRASARLVRKEPT